MIKKKKHTQIQRILRLENIVAQMYVKIEALKLIIDKDSDTILGAHLLGPEYGEIINFFGLAIRLGLTTSDLKKMVSVYPSVGSDLGSMLS